MTRVNKKVSRKGKKKSTEFSKKIVVWGMVITTIYIIAYIGCMVFYNVTPPTDLTDLIKAIVLGVIVTYAGKAGVENYQKIKNRNSENDIEYDENGGIINVYDNVK